MSLRRSVGRRTLKRRTFASKGMDDLLDSFDELSGRERAKRASYRFPDNSSHPLSSYSQRGPNLAGLQSTHDLERSKILYESAQARTQQLAQIRDAQAGLYEAEQRNRILEHSNAAFDILKSADPNDPNFERIALDINKNHARAFQDPAFKQAFDFAHGIYTRGVKADQDAKKTEVTHQNALDRATFAEELRQVRGLGSDYRQMANARLAELGPEASFADRQSVLDEIRVKADEAGRYAKLAEAGIPWEARRAGERGQDQLINPNTGMLDMAKADSWVRDATSSKEEVSNAKAFIEIARRKDPVTDAQWLSENADTIREKERLIANGANLGSRKPVEDRAWEAVAAPTRELERLNQMVQSEPDAKKKAALYNQMRPLVAQRDAAAKAHPGFNMSRALEEGETEAQMRNRIEDNARTLLSWPTDTPVTIDGAQRTWTSEQQKALAASRPAKAAAQPAEAAEEPVADLAPASENEPTPTATVPQVSAQQRREEEIKAAALERLKVPADPETAARLEAELAQVPKTGFWAALEERGGDPGTGSKAQEAVWGMFAGKAKQAHVEDRLKKLGELYNAELGALHPKPSVFEQLKQGATRDPKAPIIRLKLPPEKEAAYENAALEILADSDPEILVGRKEIREKGLRDRDLGMALRKARQEQLTAELKK